MRSVQWRFIVVNPNFLTFDSDKNKTEVENKNSFTTLRFRKDEAQIYPTQTERRDSLPVSVVCCSLSSYHPLTVAFIGQRQLRGV